MKPTFIFILFGTILFIWFMYEKIKKYGRKETIIKAAASCFFVFTAVASCFQNAVDRNTICLKVFVIAGLVAGVFGDIWLELKYVDQKKDAFYTCLGFLMFAIGHLLYILGLGLYYVHENAAAFLTPVFLLGIGVGLLTILTEKLMKVSFGKFKGIVLIYGCCLFSMVFLAGRIALWQGSSKTTSVLFFVGAVLFAVSDEILSGTYFGVGRDRPIDIILNGVTYYAAQFLIALSLSFLG